MTANVLVLGEYDAAFEPHRATERAIGHAAAALRQSVDVRWVSSRDVSETLLQRHQALWVAPGSPYRDMARTLAAIRFARERGMPCLGTCGGFQHQVIEYARSVLGIAEAAHAEYDPGASHLFIARLDCSLAGREMNLRFAPGSLVARCYGATQATELYYCNFGVAPEQVARLQSRELRIVGSDAEGEVRVIELADHPFFVGTLYVPQSRSTPEMPHPLVVGWLQAATGTAPGQS